MKKTIGCLALTLAIICTVAAASCLAQTQEDLRKDTRKNQREARIVKGMVRDAVGERPLLLRIAECRDSSTFQEIDGKQVTSVVGQMIYATKLYEFDPDEGGLKVLETLPKSDLQMQALGEFIFEPHNEALRPLGRGFYSAMFKSVVRHPEFINDVFQVAIQFDSVEWFDVEDGEWFCSQLKPLQQAIPEQYREAIKRLKPKGRASFENCARTSAPK